MGNKNLKFILTDVSKLPEHRAAVLWTTAPSDSVYLVIDSAGNVQVCARDDTSEDDQDDPETERDSDSLDSL